jgi:hypothetical protein
VTNANFGDLSLLCDEFRFTSLSESLSAFRQSADLKAAMEDSEAQFPLSVLEELQNDSDFAALRQTQESTTAALTDAIVRLSRFEAHSTDTPLVPVSASKAMVTPPTPPFQRRPPP